MSNLECSYRDHLEKSQLLHDTIAEFMPAFEPIDVSLGTAGFQSFIDTLDTKNTSVEALATHYTTIATKRVELVKTIRSTVTRVLDHLKSKSAWNPELKAARMAADKLRGVKPPDLASPPPEGEGGAPSPEMAKKRNQWQSAYVELQAHYQSFVTAVKACAGYSPAELDIQFPALSALAGQFEAENSAILVLESKLVTQRQKRWSLYFDKGGLNDRIKSIKQAVRAQYGKDSPEYAEVKDFKWS